MTPVLPSLPPRRPPPPPQPPTRATSAEHPCPHPLIPAIGVWVGQFGCVSVAERGCAQMWGLDIEGCGRSYTQPGRHVLQQEGLPPHEVGNRTEPVWFWLTSHNFPLGPSYDHFGRTAGHSWAKSENDFFGLDSKNHPEERLLDQAGVVYPPSLFWVRSRSIPRVVVSDFQPLVKSSFLDRKRSRMNFRIVAMTRRSRLQQARCSSPRR